MRSAAERSHRELHLPAAPRAISHVKQGSWRSYSFIWCLNGLWTPAVSPVTARYWVSVIIRLLVVKWALMKELAVAADGSITGGMVANSRVSSPAQEHTHQLWTTGPAENQDTAIYDLADSTEKGDSSPSWCKLQHFFVKAKQTWAVDYCCSLSLRNISHLPLLHKEEAPFRFAFLQWTNYEWV